MSNRSPFVNFKIVLLGEGSVGKTSLLLRYVQNKFDERSVPTLNASYLAKQLTIDGTLATISIWDTAGQEKFHALGPLYYRDSDGAVVVYDVTDPQSLNKAEKWIKELKNIRGESICLAMVGNKIDRLKNGNKLIAQAELYSQNISNYKHYSTSAKVNKGIDEMFLDLTKRMLEQHKAKNISNKTITSNKCIRLADEVNLTNFNRSEDIRDRCKC